VVAPMRPNEVSPKVRTRVMAAAARIMICWWGSNIRVKSFEGSNLWQTIPLYLVARNRHFIAYCSRYLGWWVKLISSFPVWIIYYKRKKIEIRDHHLS
jgi:hypothetical protein